jgi:hypothetical protein
VLAEPDPARVHELLGHILGDTQGGGALADSPDALTGRELAALALADSEARLDAAHAHYIACQPEDVDPDMADCVNVLEEFLYMDDMLDEDKREAIRRIFRVERFDARARASRQRLALRYLKEARATRDRALSAFLAYGETAEGYAI